MSGFQDVVPAAVYEVPLAAREVAPEHEDYSFAVRREVFDDRVGELLPTYGSVRCRLSAAHRQYSVEQKDSLTGP